MRFGSPRDYGLMLSFNRELMNKWVDVNVIIYKYILEESKANVYGESDAKATYMPVQCSALIDRAFLASENLQGTIDVEQEVSFSFLRYELKLRDIYPQMGDVIFFDDQFYEINRVNEIQLFAGQTKYNHQILCDTHLTRKNVLNIDEPLHE